MSTRNSLKLIQSLEPRGYAVLLPTLLLLLDPNPTTTHPTQLHMVASQTLLSLAQSSPKGFRESMQALEEGERGRLERAVRDVVAGNSNQAGGGSGGASGQTAVGERKGIELRSFG